MSYHYDVQLELANDQARTSFDFKEIEREVNTAIEQYHALDTVRHKKILTCKTYPRVLEIGIDSPVRLDVPSKALAKFTRLLLALSPALKQTIRHGRVFRAIAFTTAESSLDHISTSETLREVISLFCEGDTEDAARRDARSKKQREIKAILFNVQ